MGQGEHDKTTGGAHHGAVSSDQLLAFMQYLRGQKIAVSPADTLDAVAVAELLGYDNRSLLRNGLASTLAKSAHELTVFEAAFDQYFQPTMRRPGAPTAANDDSASATEPSEAEGPMPASTPEQGNEDPLDGLRGNSLFDALENRDDSALSVAIETAAAEAKVDDISLFTQRGQYV